MCGGVLNYIQYLSVCTNRNTVPLFLFTIVMYYNPSCMNTWPCRYMFYHLGLRLFCVVLGYVLVLNWVLVSDLAIPAGFGHQARS